MAYAFKYGDRPLDGLTVQRAVGRGGFGEVYYAVADSGKQVALKYLRENPEIKLRGVAHVMNLKSPYLVTIYDVRQNEAGEPFVIMEYVSGPSLRDVLRAEPGGLAPEKAIFIAKGIAQGLSHLHERGIVHRDLKPANIFYDDGYVKIGDYGLSKHMSVSQHSGQTISIGTVHYMAPEIGSGSYTKLVDIYALGVILYEMLSGRLPFTGASLAEVIVRQINDRPDTSVLPAGFGPIVARTLAKDPAERFQNVSELIDELARVPGVEECLSTFDHSRLAQVQRETPPVPPAVTRTTPPPVPTVEPLDARRPVGGEEQRRPAEAAMPYRTSQRLRDDTAPRESSFAPWLYANIALSVLFALVELGSGDVRRGHAVGLLAHLAVLVPLIVSGCVLVYKWWASLPNGWRRTTPLRAVGFSFIPFFNWYWTFVITCGLAVDVNRYLDSHGVERRRVSAGLALAYAIVIVVRSVLALFGVPTPPITVACAAIGIAFAVSATRACEAVVRTRMQRMGWQGLAPAA